MGSEPVSGVAKYSFGLRRLGPNGGEDRRPNLVDAVHEGDWAVVCRDVRVGFVGHAWYEFRGAYAPLFCV